jgi:hypothetical protein
MRCVLPLGSRHSCGTAAAKGPLSRAFGALGCAFRPSLDSAHLDIPVYGSVASTLQTPSTSRFPSMG